MYSLLARNTEKGKKAITFHLQVGTALVSFTREKRGFSFVNLMLAKNIFPMLFKHYNGKENNKNVPQGNSNRFYEMRSVILDR